MIIRGAQRGITNMQEIKDDYYDGERPLYGIHDTKLINTTFGKGESPLKETANLALDGVLFTWKYPLWYSDQITVTDTYNGVGVIIVKLIKLF